MKFIEREIKIEKAIPVDADTLTAISFAAKRYWNYPESYMEIWKNELTITEEYILNNKVFKASIDDAVAGYYSVVYNPSDLLIGDVFVEKGYWMEHIFIKPEFIGKGIGSLLVDHMKNVCRKYGIISLLVFADPNAAGFYDKTGAVYKRNSSSSIPGREIPVYEITV